MPFKYYIYGFTIALILGSLNSWYWYRKGYRGGKLLFMGTIAFFGIVMMLINFFFPN